MSDVGDAAADSLASGPIETLPTRKVFGDRLDWSSPLVDVALRVELPFWLMIDDCALSVSVGPASIPVRLFNNFVELYAAEVTPSGRTIVYQGPEDQDPG
jgi:hypothetical protein